MYDDISAEEIAKRESKAESQEDQCMLNSVVNTHASAQNGERTPTMQTVYTPKKYPPEILNQLKTMPNLAVEIANRWMLGWPANVRALIAAGEYMPALINQERKEREALTMPGMNHLARHEIAQEMGLSLSPPSIS